MPDGPRYDDDFYAWTQYQAEVLRSMRTRDNRFDREHVATLPRLYQRACRRVELSFEEHGEKESITVCGRNAPLRSTRYWPRTGTLTRDRRQNGSP
jgi:hypothetical protein